MRIVMTLLVRNEEDVVETSLRYHLAQGIDFIIATDNRSTDRTRQVLRHYADRGRVHLIEEGGDDYFQSRWVTRMARLAAERFAADWVINADADEFYYAEGGSLRDALAGIDARYGKVVIPRLNFHPRPETGEPFYQRLVVRDTRSLDLFGNPLPPKVCHRGDPDVTVAFGNHDVTGGGFEPSPAQPITIFHYPVRSYAQFESKIRLGGAAVARNRALPPAVCAHWRWLREALLDGGLPAYYESQLVDDHRLESGVRSGALVVDRRMAERLG